MIYVSTQYQTIHVSINDQSLRGKILRTDSKDNLRVSVTEVKLSFG